MCRGTVRAQLCPHENLLVPWMGHGRGNCLSSLARPGSPRICIRSMTLLVERTKDIPVFVHFPASNTSSAVKRFYVPGRQGSFHALPYPVTVISTKPSANAACAFCSGPVPLELVELTALQKLNLSNNKLAGEKHRELCLQRGTQPYIINVGSTSSPFFPKSVS